jgi:hypothetical protein
MRTMSRVLMISLVVLLTACTTRLLDFTVVSSKNIDLSKAETFERGKSRVEGVDAAWIIIFIPTGIPNMKEAIDRALEKVPGAVALVDGVVSSKFMYFVLAAQSAYVVEGTPLIDPALVENGELESNYMVCQMNKKGEVDSFSYVEEYEYNDLKEQYFK